MNAQVPGGLGLIGAGLGERLKDGFLRQPVSFLRSGFGWCGVEKGGQVV